MTILTFQSSSTGLSAFAIWQCQNPLHMYSGHPAARGYKPTIQTDTILEKNKNKRTKKI